MSYEKSKEMKDKIFSMFEGLEEKLKNSWKLRMYYRWAKLKLDVSEWFWKCIRG